MSMYNLLEYSKTIEITIVVNSNTFKYKNKITGNTYNVGAGTHMM